MRSHVNNHPYQQRGGSKNQGVISNREEFLALVKYYRIEDKRQTFHARGKVTL